MKSSALFHIAIFLLFCPATAFSHSLFGDWSEFYNPDSQSTYNQEYFPLKYKLSGRSLGEFGEGQSGSSNSNTSGSVIPAPMRSTSVSRRTENPYPAFDYIPGDFLDGTLNIASGAVRGAASVTWNSPASGHSGNSDDFYIPSHAVPEPATVLLFSFGGAALLLWKRRVSSI